MTSPVPQDPIVKALESVSVSVNEMAREAALLRREAEKSSLERVRYSKVAIGLISAILVLVVAVAGLGFLINDISDRGQLSRQQLGTCLLERQDNPAPAPLPESCKPYVNK